MEAMICLVYLMSGGGADTVQADGSDAGYGA